MGVQYGRFAPTPGDDFRVRRTVIDVYRTDGTKLYEEVPLEEPLLSGGERLHKLVNPPPGPWAIGVYEWVGTAGDAAR